jgi:hypothetical protein
MNTDLRKASELRNDAIRCNNRMRFIIAELSAHAGKNRELNEELKRRPLLRRLSDALNGRGRSIQNEIGRNAALINACLLEVLREVNERNRINLEALAFINRMSEELCEKIEECTASEAASDSPRTPEA